VTQLFGDGDTIIPVVLLVFNADLASISDLQVVIQGMSGRGNGGAPLGHYTRTIVFGKDRMMYIGISSLENVDADSSRSRVRRFPISFPEGGLQFESGELWADGLRNPLALAFDANNVLWEMVFIVNFRTMAQTI
jgi:glucose/arabinose dehydrogenase